MMKKVIGRNVAIASGIICILLAISLVGAIANYTSIISAKDNTIISKDSTINNLNSQFSTKDTQITENNDTISSLTTQIQEKESQIQTLKNQKPQPQTQPNDNTATLNSLNAQIATLQNQISTQQNTINNLNDKINNLTAIINSGKTQQPTLAFHVCEKGENYTWGHLPNATDTYNQILIIDNNTHNILLLPEYEGHQNWTEELAWITNNFGGKNGIPIMLDIVCGGDGTTPNTNVNHKPNLTSHGSSKRPVVKSC